MRILQILTICFALTGIACSQSEAPAKSTSALLSGTISLNPSVRADADPLAVMFVIVRTEDGGIGAVKKLLPPFQFPVPFEITSEDLMIPGKELKGTLTPTARLDKDGNANPAQPGDIIGRCNPANAELGASAVKIDLNELVK